VNVFLKTKLIYENRPVSNNKSNRKPLNAIQVGETEKGDIQLIIIMQQLENLIIKSISKM
jgi:hypothetical protein